MPEEKEQFEKVADLADLNLSAWIRKRLLSAAEREMSRPSMEYKAAGAGVYPRQIAFMPSDGF